MPDKTWLQLLKMAAELSTEIEKKYNLVDLQSNSHAYEQLFGLSDELKSVLFCYIKQSMKQAEIEGYHFMALIDDVEELEAYRKEL